MHRVKLSVGGGSRLDNHPKQSSLILPLVWPNFKFSDFLQEQVEQLCSFKSGKTGDTCKSEVSLNLKFPFAVWKFGSLPICLHIP